MLGALGGLAGLVTLSCLGNAELFVVGLKALVAIRLVNFTIAKSGIDRVRMVGLVLFKAGILCVAL